MLKNSLKKFLKYGFVATMLATTCLPGFALEINLTKEFKKAEKLKKPVPIKVEFGKGFLMLGVIEVTTKGNGIFTLPNLSLRLMDNHDDGFVYRGQLLKINIDYINLFDQRNPLPSLIVSGIGRHTGERESEGPVEDSIVVIYQLDCRLGKFVKTFSNAKFDLEMPTPQVPKIQCPEVKED